MKSNYSDYGLSGQQSGEGYDDFLCLGRKCKQRKKEKHKARMARKNAKTDARNADTERVRAETQVIQQAASSSPNPVITMPLTNQEITPPSSMASSNSSSSSNSSETAKGGTTNAIIIVVGALLIGGFLYQLSQKNQARMKQKSLTLAA